MKHLKNCAINLEINMFRDHSSNISTIHRWRQHTKLRVWWLLVVIQRISINDAKFNSGRVLEKDYKNSLFWQWTVETTATPHILYHPQGGIPVLFREVDSSFLTGLDPSLLRASFLLVLPVVPPTRGSWYKWYCCLCSIHHLLHSHRNNLPCRTLYCSSQCA